MKYTMAWIFIALLTLTAWSDNETTNWEAVCTTDTDIVFSIKAPEPVTEKTDRTEFWMRVWHPDKTVQDYHLQMWRDKSVQILKSPKSETALSKQTIAEGSPMEKIYLRIFDEKAFREWDDKLPPLGPRGEELYHPSEPKE